MGTIISSRKEGEKVVVEVLSEYEEFLHLQGHLNDIHLITENVADVGANISQRGKNEATKYFLIPRQLRKGFKFNNETSCQKIDLGKKVLFVYVVDKEKVKPRKKEKTVSVARMKNKEISKSNL